MADKLRSALCVLFVVMISMLAGCAQTRSSPEIAANFKSDFTAKYGGAEYSGSVSSTQRGIADINIEYPETLGGLEINYSGSEMHIVRGSLISSADEAYIPSDSFPSVMKSVLSGISAGRAAAVSKSGDTYVFNLNTVYGDCVVESKDGVLLKAEIKSVDFTVNFTCTEITQ